MEKATALDGHLGGQETRTSKLETTWQQRATAAEKDARQLRLDLDSQLKTQQALQKQLDEERKARETLVKQIEKLLQQSKMNCPIVLQLSPRNKRRKPCLVTERSAAQIASTLSMSEQEHLSIFSNIPLAWFFWWFSGDFDTS